MRAPATPVEGLAGSAVSFRSHGRTWAARLAFTLVVLAVLPAWGAAPADARRLRDGLEPGFRRPTVLVYPLTDERPLSVPMPGSAPTPAPVFEAFLGTLAAYENLNVVVPRRTIARIQGRPGWREQEHLAKGKVAEGTEDYRQVRLEAAIRHLREAAELFDALEYAFIEPRAVAQAERTLGLALLESGDNVDAHEAFVRALQVDPRLRMREGFDRPESIAAFERARTELAEGNRPAPARPPTGEPPGTDVFILHSRLVPARGPTPERLEVTVTAPGGMATPDGEAVSTPDVASRLAGRVWACLPFGGAVREKHPEAETRLDAGFAWFLYTDNGLGTGVFNNVGAQATFNWTVARHIGIQMAFLVANSGRDQEENLRRDVLTVRSFAGPGYEVRFGPVRLDAHLGVEVASPGRIVTTGNVYCMYPFTHKGAELCRPSDIDSTPRTALVGAGLTGGASLDLVDQLYLALHVWAAEYFFKVDETDLGRPVGTALSLGYRFR